MSPKTPIEFEKVRVESRKKIIETALKLFGTYGYVNTSIAQIAKEAGISKGLMYNYFNSKDELLEQVLVATINEMESYYIDIMQETDARKLLIRMIDFTVDFLKNQKEFNVLVTSLGLQRESHPIIKKITNDKVEQMKPFFLMKLQELGCEDAESEMYILGAAMDGMAVQYLTTEDENQLQNVVKAIKKRYHLAP